MYGVRTVTKLLAQLGAGVTEVRLDSKATRTSGAMLFAAVLASSLPAAAVGLEGGDTDAEAPEARPAVGPAPTGRLPVQIGSRGQMLYENHCLDCHESVVFIRERRTVADPTGLRTAVLRWAAELKLPWGPEELDDVARYLNAAYYHFPLP